MTYSKLVRSNIRELKIEIDKFVDQIKSQKDPIGRVTELSTDNIYVRLRLPTPDQLRVMGWKMDRDSKNFDAFMLRGIAIEAIEIMNRKVLGLGLFNYLVSQLFNIVGLQFIFINNVSSLTLSFRLHNSIRWQPLVFGMDPVLFNIDECMPFLRENTKQHAYIQSILRESLRYGENGDLAIENTLDHLDALDYCTTVDGANADRKRRFVDHKSMAFRAKRVLMEEQTITSKGLGISLDELNTRTLFKHYYTTPDRFNQLTSTPSL
ncbi:MULTISPECIES: hypothetical protein [Vibrio]|uniref:hypothetical protein n=1 Tax=Vibrio TaxID=662 RepID=UPI00062F8CAB|nr:hypothetical protein [Vibrio coralliirubri]CDT52393.1 hypothetical protein VCR1J2_610007 [Vibrio coralliirubri]